MTDAFSPTRPGECITLLLVDDHVILRETLCSRLRLESDLNVIGEASDGREAVRLAGQLRPEVVVMDIAMPMLNGLEATRQIMRILPETRVIVLSAHGDDAYRARALEAGAAAYLLKTVSLDGLCDAIRKRKPSGWAGRPSGPSTASASEMKKGKVENPLGGLTSREVEVLQLIAEGYPNKAIAAHLGITLKTVGNHREHLMAKLDIHDAASLTRYAIREGIIESGGLGGMLG